MYLRFQIPLSLIKEQVKLTLQELRSGTKGAVKLLPAPEWGLHGEENKLVCQVPVEVHARADWLELARTVLLGGSLPPLIRFRIKVIVKIQLLILGNWELKARPVVSYSWVEEPALSLGFKLPLRELVEPLLDREMQKLADNLTHWIPATVQLFDNMTQAWRETQEPRIIDSPLWLRILSKDKAIAISEIQIDGAHIFVNAAIPLKGMVSDSQNFWKDLPKQDLRAPTPLTQEPKRELPLLLFFSWSQLEDELGHQDLRASIAGRLIKVSWRKVKLRGSGTQFTLHGWFKSEGLPLVPKGRATAEVDMTWQWRIDGEGRKLLVEELQVEPLALPWWLSLAWRWLKKIAHRHIQQAIIQAIHQLVIDAHAQTQAELSQYPLQNGLILEGKIDRWQFKAIEGQEGGLLVDMNLIGEAKIKVSTFSPHME